MANMVQQTPPEQASACIKDAPFSLHHAIFLPFSGFPLAPDVPLNETERTRIIIQNLTTQQDAVRRNMVFLAKQRADNLREEAQKELRAFEAPYASVSSTSRVAKKERVDALFARLKTPPKKDTKPEDFHFKPRNATSTPITPTRDAEGDIDMNGGHAHPSTRTAVIIKEELNRNLRELTERTVNEIHSYNQFCETFNKAKLTTSSAAAAVPSPTTTTPMPPPPPRGILKLTTSGISPEGRRSSLTSASPLSATPDSARPKVARTVSFGPPSREVAASPVAGSPANTGRGNASPFVDGRGGSARAIFASVTVAKETESRMYEMKDIARGRW